MSRNAILAAVSAANVRKHVEHITTTMPSRLAGSANAKRMAEYSLEQLRAAGAEARMHELPGLVSFPDKGELRVLSPREIAIEANTLGHSLPTPPDGISGELMDVGSGAFADYEGRDATGKITLLGTVVPAGAAREAAHRRAEGRDRLRDDELGTPGKHGGAVRLGEAGVGQSHRGDVQNRNADAALHRHRTHGGPAIA